MLPVVPATISDRYTVGRMIGDGNFAVVHECVERSTGRAYALKVINKGKCRGKVSLHVHESQCHPARANPNNTQTQFPLVEGDMWNVFVSLVSACRSK